MIQARPGVMVSAWNNAGWREGGSRFQQDDEYLAWLHHPGVDPCPFLDVGVAGDVGHPRDECHLLCLLLGQAAARALPAYVWRLRCRLHARQ